MSFHNLQLASSRRVMTTNIHPFPSRTLWGIYLQYDMYYKMTTPLFTLEARMYYHHKDTFVVTHFSCRLLEDVEQDHKLLMLVGKGIHVERSEREMKKQ